MSVAAGVILLAGLSIAPISAQGSTPEVELRIGKNQTEVVPRGWVSPAQPGRRLVLKLYRRNDAGEYVRTARKGLTLTRDRDRDGDGRRDSFFKIAFPRPEGSACRVDAVVKAAEEAERVTDSISFPCGIPNFSKGSVTLSSLSVQKEIEVWIADSDAERAYGLMYRGHLDAERGMAFVYPAEDNPSGGYWMRHVLIPLSIAFYDSDGTILRILDMEPCWDDPCPTYDPGVAYRGTLEVNKGAFTEWGIAEGDTISVSE